MHSQEQLQLLLQNPMVQELLDILENEGKCVLQHLNLTYVDEVFEQQKNINRGRPWTYDPSDKLRALLYGLAEGKSSIRGVSRIVQTSVAQVFLGLEQGCMSYSTLDRFWHQLAAVAEIVFNHLAIGIAEWGMLGTWQAIDSTSIETPFLDDPDATWNYDVTKKEYYYGYGLLLVVDVDSQLPIAAQFIQRKQPTKQDTYAVINTAFSVKKPCVLIGDGGFDIIDLHEQLIDDHVLPVIRYNPRNADEPLNVKYRVEDLVHKKTDKVTLNRKELDRFFRRRGAVENTNNVLKQLGLEHLRVKGWNAVKSHVFIILILRLAIAIARYQKDQDCNLRRISIGE